jgi:hypothetical protein
MAANFTQQQINWISTHQNLVRQLLSLYSAMTDNTSEFAAETFGTGGANALTDETVQTVIPQATAVGVAGSEGAMVSVMAAITANIGYFQAIRS